MSTDTYRVSLYEMPARLHGPDIGVRSCIIPNSTLLHLKQAVSGEVTVRLIGRSGSIERVEFETGNVTIQSPVNNATFPVVSRYFDMDRPLLVTFDRAQLTA